ncbi:O-antigen ligase family protein [Sulfurimonas sp.]|uniref:O-antigen ligase family protein n=2 Tax=Sulfurimonas sp. TaxID=2022749 RepID=UPI00263225CD|nr:O-antigen ligase family protein [Sulfurimonas sp.]MDD5157641.1 O-antigen ligase family protein [Sulfurimonas sp.]
MLLLKGSLSTLDFKSFNKNKLFNYLTILLAFSIPLSKGSHAILFSALAIIWIIEGDWQKKWKMIRSEPLFKVILVFYTYLVLSLLWSNNWHLGITHLLKYYFLLLLPMFYTSINRYFFPYIISAFLAAMAISETLSYLIMFNVIHFKQSWSSADPSPFMHHTIYSIFLVLAIFILAIRLFRETKTLFQKAIFIFFITTMMANLFLNVGRTGQLSFALALIIFLLIQFRLSILKTLIIIIPVLTTVFFLAFNFSTIFKNRTIETYRSIDHLITHRTAMSDSTGLRFMMWHTAYEIIREEPFFGVGIGDDIDALHKVLTTKKIQYQADIGNISDFHNSYIQITLYGGIVGLFLWLITIAVMFRQLDDNRDIKTIGSIMLALLTLYMFIGNFPVSYLTILFTLIIGITLKRPNKQMAL